MTEKRRDAKAKEKDIIISKGKIYPSQCRVPKSSKKR